LARDDAEEMAWQHKLCELGWTDYSETCPKNQPNGPKRSEAGSASWFDGV
jgi:hypothetical protein